MNNLSKEAVETILKEGTRNMTLWCADGSFCQVPKGKGVALESGQAITMRDQNHGIQYNSTFDGPTMYGWSGGAVGWRGQDGVFQRRISWDRNNVGMAGRLYVNPGSGDRDILAELDSLRNDINNLYNNVAVRRDRDYAVKLNLNNQFADFGKSHTADRNNGWVKVKFDQF
jgi:hypothetical protein